MSHRLIVGDSAVVLNRRERLDFRKIGLTVTSPPYCLDIPYDNSDDGMPYEAYLAWTQHWLLELWHATAPGGRLCLNVPLDTNKGGNRPVYSDILGQARIVGWKYRSTIIWNEGNISSRTAWGSWRSATAPNLICPVETILVLHKGDWKRPLPEGIPRFHADRDLFLESTLALWEFGGEKKKRFGHPAPFPEELPRRCIEVFSFPGDLVCDPFMGSGTTGAVCRDRDFLGIDISEMYADTTKSRLIALGFPEVSLERYPPCSSS